MIQIPQISFAREALKEFFQRNSHQLNPSEQEQLLEALAKLDAMCRLYCQLLKCNDKLLDIGGISQSYDQKSNVLSLRFPGGFIRRLNVTSNASGNNNTFSTIGAFHGFHTSATCFSGEVEKNLRLDLATMLESFYQQAHRVLKLFGSISILNHIKCSEVSIVRNQLIEHPEGHRVNPPLINSFGASFPGGPLVKPIYNHSKHRDRGLVSNTQAFCTSIIDGLNKAQQRIEQSHSKTLK